MSGYFYSTLNECTYREDRDKDYRSQLQLQWDYEKFKRSLEFRNYYTEQEMRWLFQRHLEDLRQEEKAKEQALEEQRKAKEQARLARNRKIKVGCSTVLAGLLCLAGVIWIGRKLAEHWERKRSVVIPVVPETTAARQEGEKSPKNWDIHNAPMSDLRKIYQVKHPSI